MLAQPSITSAAELFTAEIFGDPYPTYRALREQDGDVGLSTVWLIDPVWLTEETLPIRLEREAAGRLPLVHLDRIAC